LNRGVVAGHRSTHIESLTRPIVPLDQIPYVDHPELRLDEHESTEMPFRYVKDANSLPVMPVGMLDLIRKDSEKGFGDLL
jgi:ribosome biogenesis SPOUT family RNA methylase Rps3